MKKPIFFAACILLFLGATLCVAWFLRITLIAAFFNNPILDGLILGLLAFGVMSNLMLMAHLWPLSRWISTLNPRKGTLSVDTFPTSALLTPITRLVAAKGSNIPLSDSVIEQAFDSFADRLDEKREVNRYLGGLLIFLGLLGTFYGLLLTVSSISEVIASLSINAANLSAMFDHLKEGLARPLYGMGTAFSGSMFGLAGALVIGFIDLIMGKALHQFHTQTEDRISQILGLTPSGNLPSATFADPSLSSMQAGPTSPYYTGNLLAQTAENIEQLRLTMQAMEATRAEQAHLLSALTQRSLQLEKMVESLQATQKQTLAFHSTLIEGLKEVAPQTHPADLTARIEALTTILSRQHAELSDTIRTESKLISRTLANTLSALSSDLPIKE